MRITLEGIVPPITTSFTRDDHIDEVALRTEVRYLIETARVHGLAVCRSTGEGHTLTTDETRRITAVAVEEAAGRVPVITGMITESNPVRDRARESRGGPGSCRAASDACPLPLPPRR